MRLWGTKMGLGRLLILGAVLLALTGCGGGGSDNAGSESSGGGTTPGITDSDAEVPTWDPADFDHVYDVGPGQPYADPSEVPWESLQPSTLVRIHYRAAPYRTKFIITTAATATDPLVVVGIPDAGRLPVISGENATTRSTLTYYNQPRSVVKVGNYGAHTAAHVTIQSLDIRSGRPGYTFTDNDGDSTAFAKNAAAVHLEDGHNITLQGCVLHDCGNGLFNTSATTDILIRANSIYDNGIEGSYYEHNSYTESLGIVFEYNHYGPLRAGCDGNNLKDRSAGTVIRYNWIEGGNRQLDLVEAGANHIYSDPAYDATYVYGNILVEPDGAGNSQIVHYGGDSGDTARYRKGTLYFYHNTVVSTRSGNTTLMRLSTNDPVAMLDNNLFYLTAGGSRLAILNTSGQADLSGNWMQPGWRDSHSGLAAGASIVNNGNTEGADPGFVDFGGQDFHLTSGAEPADAGNALTGGLTAPSYQYVKHQQGEDRDDTGSADCGALTVTP